MKRCRFCPQPCLPERKLVHNIPDILDVNNLIELLRLMGVEVERLGVGSYSFRAAEINLDFIKDETFLLKSRKLRGSVLLVGPLIARFGYAIFPKFGGDKIGRRRLDTHIMGIMALGAECDYSREAQLRAESSTWPKGSYMLLDEASGNWDGQHCDGRGLGRGYNHHIQRSLRAISAAAVQAYRSLWGLR